MELTFKQMDEILSKNLIDFCTPNEKKQIQKYVCRTCLNSETLFNISESIMKQKKQLEKKYIKRAIEHIKSTLDVYDYKDDFNDDLNKLITKIAKYIKNGDNK